MEDDDSSAVTEAVTELYEDLATRVGKELVAVIRGKYHITATPTPKEKKPTKPKAVKKEEWNITPWRPKSPTKKKKKKLKPVPPRRPFGPTGTVFPPGKEGDIQYIEFLLSPWGAPTAVDWCDPDNNQMSPIILAASVVVSTLLTAAASVFARSTTGNTALHEAAKGGHTNIVLILLKAGSEVDAKNQYGNTPLSSSIRNGHSDVCEILVLVGADIECKNNNGESPLDRTTNPDLKALIRLRRLKFEQLAAKRIAALTLVQTQKQQALRAAQAERRAEEEEEVDEGDDANTREMDSTSDGEAEGKDKANVEGEASGADEGMRVEAVVDIVPVGTIVSEFQQTLARRAKLAAGKRNTNTVFCSTAKT